MVLYNVPVLLELIVVCIVCSTTLQNYSANSAVLHYKLYSVNSAVLQYKLYSLCSTTVQTINSAVLQYKLYSVSGTTLPSVFTLQYYTTNSIL